MELQDYRRELDTLDDGLLELFCRRMEIAAKIGAYKKEKGLPVLDAAREREKLLDVAKKSPEGMEDYTVSLFSLIMELSRSCQNRLNGTESALTEQIREAIDTTPQLFPPMATVACQGTEEDASRLACDRLFKLPNILGFNSYDAVFSAVEKGLCQYGVVPVENSAAGSVNAVYDLMMQHDFRIVRSVRLKTDRGNDYTRFICFSRRAELYPGADRTSLMLVLPNKTGSLYKLLSRFYALGINLIKLESRPMPERNFEFMFYFDLDTSIYSPAFLQLMGELDSVCEEFHYLGSYSEVI